MYKCVIPDLDCLHKYTLLLYSNCLLLYQMMINRISEILKSKSLTASKFADEIGVQRSNVSHVLSGRNKPSLEFIMRILEKYPEINSDWLLFGKGSKKNIPEEDLFTDSGKTDIPVVENKEVKSETSSTDRSAEVKKKEVPASEKKTQPSSIEKVVVLYNNNTFKEYYPED